MTLDDILLEAEDKMIKTEQVVVNEFSGVRTGKASPALVENIMVEVYGSNMRVRELAGITTPEPRTLAIQPWDANSVHPIEKAIQKANLGLNPAVQGKLIRIFFPELSQERRQEFVKIVRKRAEDGRVAVRNVRREAMEQLKKHAHDSGVTEDEEEQAKKVTGAIARTTLVLDAPPALRLYRAVIRAPLLLRRSGQPATSRSP